MKKINFDKAEIDALKETLNIGAGHAAKSLSEILNRRIMISVVKSGIVPSESFAKNMMGDEKMFVIALYLKTIGDADGSILFMFDRESAARLVKIIKPNVEKSNLTDAFMQPVLEELASILTGAFLSIISDMLSVRLLHEVPCCAFDQANSVIEKVCNTMFDTFEDKLCLATEFIEANNNLKGAFAFIATQDSLKDVLKMMQNKIAILKEGL